MKTITSWTSGFAFNSRFKNNEITLDNAVASEEANSGFSPRALLLSGLAGCTGIDLVAIPDKMKAPYKSIQIETAAGQTTTHPRVFKSINISYFVRRSIQYRLTIPAAYKDKVKRAVHLSLEKYCGVAAMLRQHCAIHASVIIE